MVTKIARAETPPIPGEKPVRTSRARRSKFRGVLAQAKTSARTGAHDQLPVPVGIAEPRTNGERWPTLPREDQPPAVPSERDSPRDADDVPGQFTPLPSILGDRAQHSVAPTLSTSHTLAEAAAMADRMVTSMSLGRIGRDGHAVRMKLSLGSRGVLGVSLALTGDDLEVTLDPDSASHSDAVALASALEQELGVSVTLR